MTEKKNYPLARDRRGEVMEELKPCFHEGEKEYIVCDSCLRRWNTQFSDCWKRIEELEKIRDEQFESFQTWKDQYLKERSLLESENKKMRQALQN